jgi:hypothetical protein
MHSFKFCRNLVPMIVLAVVPGALMMKAQTTTNRPMITERIDESRLHRLAGNTRPEVRPENDLGAVADEFPIGAYDRTAPALTGR